MSSVNVLHILRVIKERASVSRTDLQAVTGLSWGTITNTTRELLNRNLIREEGALSTRAGRKPVRLAINPNDHALIGLDIAPGRMECLGLNLAGEELWHGTAELRSDESPESALDRAATLLRQALEVPEVKRRTCLGIGISLPGALDVRAGILRFAPRLPNWRDVPVREILQSRLGATASVLIEHDPNCLALAERWFGEADGGAASADTMLCVHLGEGVGLGILLAGEIFRGSQQMAGEFGHTTLDPQGPPCACGDRGCVESYCSRSAVVAYAHSVAAKTGGGGNPDTMDELIAKASRNDPAALECFAHMGKYLGIGLANLIDILNPEVIVLAGDVTAAATAFMPELQRAVERHAWPHSQRKLLISRLGERGKVMGACGMILQTAITQNIALGEAS